MLSISPWLKFCHLLKSSPFVEQSCFENSVSEGDYSGEQDFYRFLPFQRQTAESTATRRQVIKYIVQLLTSLLP